MTRIKAEMQALPARKDAWNGVPQLPEHHSASSRDGFRTEYDGNGAPLRRETQSGIPGLTFDQVGRPV